MGTGSGSSRCLSPFFSERYFPYSRSPWKLRTATILAKAARSNHPPVTPCISSSRAKRADDRYDPPDFKTRQQQVYQQVLNMLREKVPVARTRHRKSELKAGNRRSFFRIAFAGETVSATFSMRLVGESWQHTYRGGSSVGRALRSQCRGRGFNSLPLQIRGDIH